MLCEALFISMSVCLSISESLSLPVRVSVTLSLSAQKIEKHNWWENDVTCVLQCEPYKCLSYGDLRLWPLTLRALFAFLPCCSYAGEVFLWASVCPSVCPSNACTVTKRMKVLPTFLYHMKGQFVSSSFPTRIMVDGDVSLYLIVSNFGQTGPTAWKTAIINRYSIVAPQPLDLGKSSIMTNRQSTTTYPVSLKVYFSRRMSAAKFLFLKTFSCKVLWYSLAYLDVHGTIRS